MPVTRAFWPHDKGFLLARTVGLPSRSHLSQYSPDETKNPRQTSRLHLVTVPSFNDILNILSIAGELKMSDFMGQADII